MTVCHSIHEREAVGFSKPSLGNQTKTVSDGFHISAAYLPVILGGWLKFWIINKFILRIKGELLTRE